MKKRIFPEMSKLPYLWRAVAAGLAGLLTTSVYEAMKQLTLGNLTPWESHTITISYYAALAFIVSAVCLRREAAKNPIVYNSQRLDHRERSRA